MYTVKSRDSLMVSPIAFQAEGPAFDPGLTSLSFSEFFCTKIDLKFTTSTYCGEGKHLL